MSFRACIGIQSAILMMCISCAKHNPIAPTVVAEVAGVVPDTRPVPDARVGYTGPVAHNIPVIMPDGVSFAWMCETKPRPYTRPDGQTEWTLDHYITDVNGKTGCPDVPID
jgi:hypothetical protein